MLLAGVLAVAGCNPKDVEQGPPTYAGGVGDVLVEACAECHGSVDPAAGYVVTTVYESIGCLDDGRVATLPADASAPIVAVLARADHADAVDTDIAALITAWVETNATDRWDHAHPPGFTDPRSESFHGWVLRAGSWDAMYDADRPDACGRCHEGAPARPEGVGVAPDAPACTSCHDRPEGVLDCATCHGAGDRAHPPRDECYFGERAGAGLAHAAHEDRHIDCVECHGERDGQVGRGGPHGNGAIEIQFSELAGGDLASYDAETGTCAVYCHDRGGERPMPSWGDEVVVDCNGCHLSPPPDHYVGTCDRCHAEANEDGTALFDGPLHINGVVDLGDGGGGCGACHGAGGDDAWPRTHAHDGHRAPTTTTQAPCADCHPIPDALDDPPHFDGAVNVELRGLAAARSVDPVYRPDTQTCVAACHGENIDGRAVLRPTWTLPEEVAGRCDACHGLPPASTHPVAGACASTLCHGGEVAETPSGPRITEPGRTIHIDGMIDFGGGP